MKLLIFTTLFISFSAMASSYPTMERDGDKIIITTGFVSYRKIFSSGCENAKKAAQKQAGEICYQYGLKNCKEIDVKIQKIRGKTKFFYDCDAPTAGAASVCSATVKFQADI